jgi:hypothetical protein
MYQFFHVFRNFDGDSGNKSPLNDLKLWVFSRNLLYKLRAYENA